MPDDRELTRLDLDRLTRLATQDPEAFEAERRRLVEALIESAPDSQRQRLRGLQWRVDTLREHAPTPMAACLKISGMMWDHVMQPGGLLDAFGALKGEKTVDELCNPGEGRLLEFRRPPDD